MPLSRLQSQWCLCCPALGVRTAVDRPGQGAQCWAQILDGVFEEEAGKGPSKCFAMLRLRAEGEGENPTFEQLRSHKPSN